MNDGDEISAPLPGAMKVVIFADQAERAARLREQIASSKHGTCETQLMSLRSGIESLHPPMPELAILDVQETGIDPLHYIKQLQQVAPATRIVIISRASTATLAQRALRAGASAFLTNEEVEPMLIIALERIMAGERFVSDEIMQGILHGMVETGDDDDHVPVEALSDREMVIFQMVGLGKPFRQIASELNVNIKTVATHCNNIRRKLHRPDNRALMDLCQSWVKESHVSHA